MVVRRSTEFDCLNLWQSNGHVFAKDLICYFLLLVRESWSGTLLPHFFRSYEKRCQKSTRRACKPSWLPLEGNGMYFFRLYEKSTKKVHQRTLPSGLPAPSNFWDLTAILEIPQYVETQKSAVFLYISATAGWHISVFVKFLSFCYNGFLFAVFINKN